MTREQLAAALARMKQATDERMTIVRVVVDPTGRVIRRIFRGTCVFKSGNAGASVV